jgi:hypothetical protein
MVYYLALMEVEILEEIASFDKLRINYQQENGLLKCPNDSLLKI